MSHPIFLVLKPIFCYVSLKIVNFHEPLIIETCNKCHWIWHASNPKYIPLKQFWCIFPSQNQQNVKFLLEIVIFQEPLIAEILTCGIGFGMPWTLNVHHSSHFNACFPVKINKMWNFGCFLNSPDKKLKKCQFAQGKVFAKACKSAHTGFLGMLMTTHYVRTLCDKYFLSYYGFSAFLWEGQDIGLWNMV